MFFNQIKISFLIGSSVLMVLLLASCKSSTGPEEPVYTALTITSQTSYVIINTGTQTAITWAYPSNWPYVKTVVDLSISNTSKPSWQTISSDPISFPNSSLSYTFKASQIGDSCRIRIYDYDKNIYAYSSYFKIAN